MKPPVQHVLTLEVATEEADPLAAELFEQHGLSPVQLQKPGSPVAWLDLYFDDPRAARRAARAYGGLPAVRACQIRRCAPRDWLAFWRRHFHAQDIGRHLRVAPVWDRRPAPRGRRLVRLDPGASFGTGDHFTTRFCLEMIDRLCQKRVPRNVLDVGTGSGILAIAALRLGSRSALGVDHDPLALRQAERNARLNRVARRVTFRAHDVAERPLAGSYDLVCANIVSGVLIELAPALVRVTRRHLALSGIREPEVDGVAEVYAALGGREVVRDGDGEWAGLLFELGAK